MPRKKITEPEELEQGAITEQPAGENMDAPVVPEEPAEEIPADASVEPAADAAQEEPPPTAGEGEIVDVALPPAETPETPPEEMLPEEMLEENVAERLYGVAVGAVRTDGGEQYYYKL